MVAFVHLSDIHFSGNNDVLLTQKDVLINDIYSHICQYDHTFIITSGDLAFAGKKEEYEKLLDFYTMLKSKLDENNVSFEYIFAPGNHDCDFMGCDLDVRRALLSSNHVEKGVLTQLKEVQTNYDEFVSIFEPKYKFSSPLLSLQSNIITGKVYNFFIFNTSLFSQKNEQYGSLHFPQYIMDDLANSVQINSDDINIAVLHHPANWFTNEEFHNLIDFIEDKMNFVFSGHEHTQNDYFRFSNNKRNIHFFEGAELSENNTLHEYGIHVIKNGQIISTKLLWNGQSFDQEEHILPVTFSPNGKHPTKEFLNSLNNVMLLPNIDDNITLSDIFVTPYITTQINDDDDNKGKTLSKIDTADILTGKLNKKFLFIKGEARFGKTSLLKMIYKERCKQHLYPIYIDVKKFNTAKFSDIEKLTSVCFSEQYQNHSNGDWNAIAREDKVILIDDIDYDNTIRNIIAFLLGLKKIAGEVIATSSSDLNEATFVGKKDSSDFFDIFNICELIEWNRTKKIELFTKWLNISKAEIDARNIEMIERELSIPFHKGMIPSTPFYLLSSLYLSMKGPILSGTSSETGRAEFYRTIINYSLLKIGISDDKLTACHNFIENIAKEMLKKNTKSLSKDDLLELSASYIQDKMLPSLPIKIENLIESRIFQKHEDEYSFSFDYIYYFFVAAYISKNMNEENIKEKLAYILNHLYTRDNANIAIFISYHSNDSVIIEAVKAKAKEIIDFFTQKIEEDISWDHIDFINELINEMPKLIQPASTGIDFKKKEAKILDDNDDKMDEYGDERENKALEALKLSEIIGCLLKNHTYTLNAEPKKELCRYGYLLHKVILSSYIYTLKQDKDGLLSFIEAQLSENLKTVNSETIRNESNKIIFYITSLMYLGTAVHLTTHLANQDLLPVNSILCNDEKLQSKFMDIVDLFNHIQYENEFPYKNKLLPLFKKIGTKEYLFKLIITLFILRYIAVNYNNIDRNIRDGIFHLLNVSEQKKTQLLINSAKND
jgi:3',5'-cyclic AMP phosphodiesterase CpdA